jgi:hypothetical protein
MELLEVKISRRKSLVHGIKLKESRQWLALQHNPVDYVLDGVSFINQDYIKFKKDTDKNSFEYKVLNNKFNKFRTNNHFPNEINTFHSLLSFILNEKKLIELEFESEDYCIIGKLNRLNEKSFHLNKLTIKGEFIGEETFLYSKIRVINLYTDYLNSIQDFLDSQGNE